MSKVTKIKKYRHSSTFYRKLRKRLSDTEKSQTSKVGKEKSLLETNKFVNVTKHYRQTIQEHGENVIIDKSESEDISDKVYHVLPLPQNQISESFDIAKQLQEWALKHRITHSAVNDLLIILKGQNIQLPCDSRSLLNTPSFVHITPMVNGEFWYNGIKNNLLACAPKALQLNKNTLSLIFNVDGMPPFKSTPLEFWPILFRVEEIVGSKPMVVAIYCGQTKPPLEFFMEQFVSELNDILKHGITYNGLHMTVCIKYFVCDTPARSFIKGTVGFNASHGCIKCTVTGEYDKGGRHMSFPRTNCPLRTNESFRREIDEDHHKVKSPLLKLPIDMIEDIIVADSLHLFDLGVMRKCLYGWVYGNYNFKTKFSGKDIDQISELLKDCNQRRPSEIHRAIRTLKCVKFWKGSEYRTFLLYLGPVVLKNFLSTEVYHNYLLLFCAVTILSCKTYLKYVDVAADLLINFIQQFGQLYGVDAISSNIHNLCHVVNDVKKFGSLPEISAYPFENFLGQIKSLLRSGKRPLAQIAKRVSELSNFNNSITQESPKWSTFPKNEVFSSHIRPDCDRVFNAVHISDKFILSNNIRNKWFLTLDNNIVELINVTYYKGIINIYGKPLKEKQDFFDLPLKSSYLNIYAR